jgi:Response regulator containing CheY-like receiver domain and AraC-type DNA-binding domain
MTFFRSTFVKYFVSFFVIFLIPLLILGLALYWNMVHKYREKVAALNVEKLEQVKVMLEDRFRDLEQTAAWISFDPRLTPYRITRDLYSRKEAVDELKKYRTHQGFADEIFLYYRNGSHLYSPSGSIPVGDFLDHVYTASDPEDLRASLDASDRVILSGQGIYRLGQDTRMISYLVPIPLNTQSTTGSVLFLLKEEKLTKLLEFLLGSDSGAAYILDRDGRIMASASSAGFDLRPSGGVFDREYPAGLSTISLNGERYTLAQGESDKLGWKIVSVVPTRQFFGSVIETQTLFYGLVAVLLFIGMLTSFIVSRRHYRPIRDLIHYSTSLFREERACPPAADEFRHIRSVLDEAAASHRKLHEELEEQRPYARQQVIMKLLNGGMQRRSDIHRLLEAHEIRLPGPRYFVLYISLDNDDRQAKTAVNRDRVMDYFACVDHELGWGYGTEGPHDKVIAVVVNLRETVSDPVGAQERIVRDLAAEAERITGREPTIGVGNICDRIWQLNRSFIEASAAHEYKWKKGVGRQIYFRDIKSLEHNCEWYPLENQVLFFRGLRQGDREVASAALTAMMDELRSQDTSFLLMRSILYEIINVVLKTLKELNVPESARYARELLSFGTLDELESKLQQVLLIVCSHVEQIRESNNISLRNAVLNYIREHFRSYHFSLEQVSEHFQISSSYLSRFIKDQTGHTFMEYVTYLKITEAKKQLIQSDRSIHDIVASIGYQNTSSFIRKFKAVEGMTPKRYRELYSKTASGLRTHP